MRVHDDTISLRSVEADHLDRIVDYLAHPELMGLRGIEGDRDRPMSRAELLVAVESFPKPQHGEVFGIWAEGILTGHVEVSVWWDALSPIVSLVVDPAHRRRRVGTAAARLVLAHLFDDSPANVIQTWIPAWNEGGIRFAKGLGFATSGIVRRTGIRHGGYVDSVALHLTRPAWRETPWR